VRTEKYGVRVIHQVRVIDGKIRYVLTRRCTFHYFPPIHSVDSVGHFAAGQYRLPTYSTAFTFEPKVGKLPTCLELDVRLAQIQRHSGGKVLRQIAAGDNERESERESETPASHDVTTATTHAQNSHFITSEFKPPISIRKYGVREHVEL
jgi:hypothetical protein